jgi:hypothetical protein
MNPELSLARSQEPSWARWILKTNYLPNIYLNIILPSALNPHIPLFSSGF